MQTCIDDVVEYCCDGCQILIDPEREVRYHCATCGDFDACEECIMGEEVSHPHPLQKIKPKLRAKLLYSLKDPKTGNTLYLSNFPVVIPGSPYLTQHNIRAVLSVIQFEKDDGTYELAEKAFLKGKEMHKSAAAAGVVYHHIDIPDLQNPALLADYGAFNVLEEATAFLDKAIANGNVVVHCKEGQRRSPTMFMAWMITRGFDVDKSIKMIGKDYNDPHFEWKDKYVKTRASWIVELRKWEKEWQAKQDKWKQGKGKETVEDWDRLFLGEASIATRVRKRKRAGRDEDLLEELASVQPASKESSQTSTGKRKREDQAPAKSSASQTASSRNRLQDILKRFEDMEEQKEQQKKAEKRMRSTMAKEAARIEATTSSFLMSGLSSQSARRRAFEERRRKVESVGFHPANARVKDKREPKFIRQQKHAIKELECEAEMAEEEAERIEAEVAALEADASVEEAVEDAEEGYQDGEGSDKDDDDEAEASDGLDSSSSEEEAEAEEEDDLKNFIAYEAEEDEEEEDEEEEEVQIKRSKRQKREPVPVTSMQTAAVDVKTAPAANPHDTEYNSEDKENVKKPDINTASVLQGATPQGSAGPALKPTVASPINAKPNAQPAKPSPQVKLASASHRGGNLLNYFAKK